MGASRDELMEKSKAYLEHYQECKQFAYEHPEFKKHFDMAHQLSDYIVNQFEAGNLDGKDLFDCPIVIKDLFNLHKDENKRLKALKSYEAMKQAISQYLADDDDS